MQNPCVPIRSEKSRKELAHHRDRTSFFQNECWKSGHLVNAASTAHAGERRNCRGQLHGQGNRPLARIVACSRGTLAHEKLNVIEGGFTVECLTKVHPSLAQHTDGPVA